MEDHPNRVIHGRTAQHASVRHERMRVVSQVTGGATPIPARPSPSVLVDGPSSSVPVERGTPSTTASWRLRHDAEGSSVPSAELREDDPVSEPVWYSWGPIDMSLLIGHADHSARHIGEREERDPQRFYNHAQKIVALAQPDESWFQDALLASSLRDLCTVGFQTIPNGMLMEFAERWHPETSSFHLPHGEITITLDDITCLLHLPNRDIFLSHGRLTEEEAMEMLIGELGVDPDDALEEVERTRGAHVRFHTF
ncbi:protein MAIN-LIKE 1-like [Vicia villosa]|uniref:protein MAIN-LIKE 1-like n=1 Tax=Vicia villosa TaxID=3911 RepID=UPI00273CBC06|nr:protein MAIN-LIKE 1-like [Vicia villosa]